MHFLTLTTLGLSLLSVISGASVLPHGSRSPRDHRAMAARKAASADEAPIARDYALETFNEALEKRQGKVKVMRKRQQGGKTCRVRVSTVATGTATATAAAAAFSDPASSSSSDSSQPTSSVVGAAAAVIIPVSTTQSWTQTDSGNWGGGATSSTTSTSATSTSTHAPVSTPPPANTGFLNAWSDQCGQCDSSAEHPNGSQNWLACGLSGAGWNPPNVAAKDLISVADPNTHADLFGPCLPYLDIFKDAAAKYGMPTALLLSISLQESTCNPNAVGARGEQGLMQVAGNACTQSDCREPWYNIHRGAEILVSDKLGGDPNGNIIAAMGAYNGWFKGMKVAAGAQYGPDGQTAQYLDHLFNYWMQGKSPY